MSARRFASVPVIAGIAFIAAIATTDSSAQGRRARFSTELSSVNELHVETVRLDEAAQRCGLIGSDLETPTRLALEASRLRLDQTATNFIFVTLNVVAVADLCTAAIDVELFRWSNEFSASVSVWSHKSVIVGGKAGFNSRVSERVGTLTEEFVADWLKARR